MSVFTGVARFMAGAVLILGAALSMTACGGGGAAAGTPVLGVGGGTGGTGGTTATDAATIALTLSSSTVTAAAPATVTATVKNKSGTAVPGLVVKFAIDAGLGKLSAPSALTDANGVATVILSPTQSTTTGADTVRATVSYLDKDYAGSAGFQLSATNVAIASFTADVAQLSAYGQANLTVVLSGASASNAVNLVMTSACAASGKGAITPSSQTTSTGTATFTFRDGGCGAVAIAEKLQVSVTGTTLTQTLTLPVSSPAAASIGFVSASPSNIYLRSSGLVESSNVTFKVKDANNNGLPGQTVVLEASTQAGGLALDGVTAVGATPPQVSKQSDSDGNVIVRINSGSVPTPVRIKATLQGSNISTVSSVLAIAVGLPSQLNFSMAQGTINIEGYKIQGTRNTYTVLASDRLANPVPEGTAVNFVSEGGQIEAIKQTTINGSGLAEVTANFASGQPVPQDGRITVVAYALGEKSFLDANGNNVHDAGEDFQDLGDIFIDRKYDNYFDPAEDQYISVSFGDAQQCTAASSPLLALDVSSPSRPNTCSQSWGRAYVRRAVQTILSTSVAAPRWGEQWPGNAYGVNGDCGSKQLLTGYASGAPINKTYRTFGTGRIYTGAGIRSGLLSFAASDDNPIAYNPVAAGTTISVVGTDGLTVNVLGGSPVPSTSTPTSVAVTYKFSDTVNEGTVAVTFKSPGGLSSTFTQDIVVGAHPDSYLTCTN